MMRENGLPAHVLITGGAGQIGVGIARRLLHEGIDVAISDTASRVFAVATQLRQEYPGRTVAAAQADVTSGDIDDALEAAADELHGLDTVVHTAAVGGGQPLADSAMADVLRIVNVNLGGTLNIARAVSRRFRDTGGGCLILFGSIFGSQGRAGSAAYGATKAGIANLTQTLALETAPYGVRVNCVAPGNIGTELHWAALRRRAEVEGRPFDELVSEVRRGVPLGRHGTPADIAGAVLWLISDDASYVTGQTIVVDGGALLTAA